jgi:hypothetical protein
MITGWHHCIIGTVYEGGDILRSVYRHRIEFGQITISNNKKKTNAIPVTGREDP